MTPCIVFPMPNLSFRKLHSHEQIVVRSCWQTEKTALQDAALAMLVHKPQPISLSMLRQIIYNSVVTANQEQRRFSKSHERTNFDYKPRSRLNFWHSNTFFIKGC